MVSYPRIPGHEIGATIEALAALKAWSENPGAITKIHVQFDE
jgi:hypothetical protein